MTILALSTEKLGMHVKHETDLKAMLSQLSTESSKQSNVRSNINQLLIIVSVYEVQGRL